MAEVLGTGASIAGIVGFGLHIATTIQTYVESVSEAEEGLRDIAFEISSTASTLSQLREVLETEKATNDANQGPKVFKDEGIKQIEVIVEQCDRVCKSIVLFILKAGAGGGKAKLTRDTLDVRTFTASSLTRDLKWSWLEPRIKRSREKLKWLNIHLLLYLQVASLVRLQIRQDGRPPGSFDEELAQRVMTERLKQRSAKYTKKLAWKFRRRDEAESCAEVETVSSTCSVVEIPLKDTNPEPNAQESKKGDLLSTASGTTAPYSGSPASSKSDLKIDSSNVCDAPGMEGNQKDKDLKEESASINGFQTSGTLVGDGEEPSSYQAKIEDELGNGSINADKLADSETFIKDKVPRPISPGRPGNFVQDPLGNKPPLFKQTELVEDLKKEQELVKEAEKKPEIASIPLFEPNSGASASWLSRLFGKRDKFMHDWESQALEAFIVHKDSQAPVKLPFGHQRLTFGLKQVMKTDNYLSWDQYLLLESQHHRAIDQIIADAKQFDSHQRTFLALVKKQGHSQNEDRILIFFSLGGPGEAANLTHTMGRKFGFSFGRNRIWELRTRIVEAELAKLRAEVEKPAREAEQAKRNKMKVIRFKDAVGRKFSFPFDTVKTWLGMEELIRQAFLHVEIIGPHVAEGHYDLVGPSGEIVLPQVWESMVEPGWAVTMHMWPIPERPKPRAPPPPPPGWFGPPPGQRRNVPPPPPPPGWIGPGLDELIVIDENPRTKSSNKKTSNRRRFPFSCSSSSSSSDSDSYFTDSDKLVSDSEIDDDDDNGLDDELQTGIDFEKEEEKVDVPLGELLEMFTNATDTGHKIIPRVVKAELADSDSESDDELDLSMDD